MLLLMLAIGCAAKGGDCGCGWYGCFGCFGCAPGCTSAWAGPGGYPYGYGYPGYPYWANNAPTSGPTPVQAAQIPAPASARVVVKLPAKARFFIGDRPWNLNAATQTFKTPPLRQDYRYEYTLRAEVTRNGRTVSQSKVVTVLAGQETKVEFGEMSGVEVARP